MNPRCCTPALARRLAELLPAPLSGSDRRLWVELAAEHHTRPDVVLALARTLRRSCKARRRASRLQPDPQLQLQLN